MKNRVEFARLFKALYPDADPSVFTLCERAHGINMGSYETSENEASEIRRLLEFVLDNWEESRNGFDDVVKELIKTVLRESDPELDTLDDDVIESGDRNG